MRSSMLLLLLTVLGSSGCKRVTPAADPAFSDALAFLMSEFEGPEAELAFAIRDLEEQIVTGMDLDASNPADRALAPEALTEDAVADLDRTNTDRDLARALPVAVAARSPHSPEAHASVQLMVDQTPVEPYSPTYYERTFLDGDACWGDASCADLRTHNDLVKENFLMTVDLQFFKDFRWVDLGLPDPSEVADGEDAINDGDPRWAFVGRSWQDRSFAGRKDNAWVHQSYTIEVWIPDGDGTLRMLCLWSETEFDGIDISDDQVIATTRAGIDRNFEAADDWLDDAGR